MRQQEIDEVSIAFKDAWTDYFGDTMYYVVFDSRTSADSLYSESKQKTYDFTNKKLFHGSLRESPSTDELHQAGHRVKKDFEITFVTKELIDNGISTINVNDIIMYVDRFGGTHYYEIIDEYQKVQLGSNKIFTKLRVKLTKSTGKITEDLDEYSKVIVDEVIL